MKRIIIVDTKLLMYTEYHRGNDTSAMFQALALELGSLGYSSKNSKIFFAYDAPEGSKRRKALYPAYKANRDDKEAKMTKIEVRRFKEFKREYVQYKKVLNHFGNVLYLAGWEADDFADLVCERFGGKEDTEIILVSSDRDWSKLMGEHTNVKLFHWARKLLIVNQEQVADVFKVPSKDCIPVQAMAGIPKENVFGIVNFGPTRFMSTITDSSNLPLMFQQVQEVLDQRTTKAQRERNVGKWSTKLPEGYTDLETMYRFNHELLRPVTMADLDAGEKREFIRQFSTPKPETSVHSIVGEFAKLSQVYMPDFNIINFFNFKLPEQV